MSSILIVDDKEENRYYLRSLLEGNGYVVDVAPHGAEALIKARQAPPALVIADLLMPVMDGYTLLRHWKADRRLKQIPFIVYTATYTEAEDERLALDLGADAFILKPSEPEDFMARLREVQAKVSASIPAAPNHPVGDETALLKYYSQALIRKLEEKTLQLEEANRSLKIELAERRSVEQEINFKNLVLQTQQETSLDAIAVVGNNDQLLSCNQQFIDLWGIPAQLIGRGLDSPMLQFVADQVINKEAFVAKVHYLYAHHSERSNDELLLKDGRIIDRYSAPIIGADQKYLGRVWYFRDITERKHAEAALRASELRYHSLFENMLEGYAYCETIFEQDVMSDFVYLEVNEAFGRLTGLKNVVGKKIGDIIPGVKKDNPELFEMYGRAALTGQPQEFETYMPALGGWLSLTVYSSDREHFVAVFENITKRKESEARILYLNRVYAVLSGINTLIVHARDRDELFSGACRIAVEAGGFRMALLCTVDSMQQIIPCASSGKSEELIATIKNILSSPLDAPKTIVARAIREKRPIVSNDLRNDPQVVFGRQGADSGVSSMAVMPLMGSDEVLGVLALYADEREFFHQEEMKLLNELTDDIAYAINHIEKQERLNYLAYYDVLTGLANRSLFLERVGQLISTGGSDGQRIAVGLIDLERFQNINDSLGRPAGDVLLKQVAKWLTRFAHDANLLARIDADHYAFVVPAARTSANLTKLFDKVAQIFLTHTFRVGNTELRLAAKTGIALFPDDGADAETVFRNAEAALKAAKKRGDRYLFHTKKMTAAVAAKLTLENQLRQALDNEEFVLHYQPKVNLMNGKVSGAEALIRWNEPRTGLVPPGKFIPILEETGLIYDVGRWAMRKAVEDYLRWRAAGLLAVRVAVNVSPQQLRNPGFVAEIEQKIGIGAHAADGLELEITESMIMEDIKHSISCLKAIREMGVHIAIDDFGTGFSSLGYLSKLPADTLKIDRSFVIDMAVGPQGLALVSTIIDLAHALKLNVIAEGVETAEQSRLLRLLNCNEMQGFLFSKPVPVEIFETKFLTPSPIG